MLTKKEFDHKLKRRFNTMDIGADGKLSLAGSIAHRKPARSRMD